MDRCYMTEQMYEVGKLFNAQFKRDVTYSKDQIINLMCAEFCNEILSVSNYSLLPEQVTTLKQIIQDLWQ